MRLYLPLLLLASSVLADQSSVTDYAPQTNVQCPDTVLLRVFTPQNQSQHPQEIEYINQRESTVIPAAWNEWLGDGSAISYDIYTFADHFPRIGIAFSGGGLRAAQYGAGVLSALDARNASAKAAGTGGLLQVSSYMAGLSGGSWLTSSLFMNDWPTIPDLIYGNGANLTGWLLDLDLITPDGTDLFSDLNQAYYGSILWSIISKATNGIDTSITDIWSRMISYHFLNQTSRGNFFTNSTSHGAGQLWSQVPLVPSYQRFAVPFPIIYANSRPVGSNDTGALPLDSTVYEITPLEFGSWDPGLSAMVNVTYAGTHLTTGQPPNSTGCVSGFDQVGFVIGTSASLFNQLFDFAANTLSGFSSQGGSGLTYLLTRQLRSVRTRANDVANWPSPFHTVKNSTFQDSNSTWLELIDGSSNQENMPLTPLLVKARQLDVIIAVDASADDSNSWVNGTSFEFTSLRIKTLLLSTHQGFPPIPETVAAFISTGLNMRPAFFGCDPSHNPPEYPLIISLPNSPPINGDKPVTNTGTFKTSYTLKHTQLFLDQVHNTTINGFTPNANTPDPNWGLCLQCAAIDRSRYKLTPIPPRSALCSQCFQQYCFDPQNPPSRTELPNRQFTFTDPDPVGLNKVTGFFSLHKFQLVGGLAALAAFIALVIFGLIWWKKRKDRRRAQYQNISELHEADPSWHSNWGNSYVGVPTYE